MAGKWCGLTLILTVFEKLPRKHEVKILTGQSDVTPAAMVKLMATAHNDAR